MRMGSFAGPSPELWRGEVGEGSFGRPLSRALAGEVGEGSFAGPIRIKLSEIDLAKKRSSSQSAFTDNHHKTSLEKELPMKL